jgi:primary-amine oxidase
MVAEAFGQPCSSPYYVERGFPTSGTAQTRWRICWQIQPQYGLTISSADFRKSPSSPWITILNDTRVSEIFVPYHDGDPNKRFYDIFMSTSSNNPLEDVSKADCPAGTRFLNKVCLEVNDRGIIWKDGPNVRRGQEVVLWGALKGANYTYIQEWKFRDDGVLEGRVGATGQNYGTSPTMAHMHNVIWRIDADLNGGSNNSVALGTHQEMMDQGVDTMPSIPAASGHEWNQFQFNFLGISDAVLTNGHMQPTSYMLMPLLFGTSRHTEPFTKNDFWVTPHNNSQMDALSLPSYTMGQNVANADIVVWYKGSLHHIPRAEDGEVIPGNGWRGETHLMWTGFIMMPNNLFYGTPLYP